MRHDKRAPIANFKHILNGHDLGRAKQATW